MTTQDKEAVEAAEKRIKEMRNAHPFPEGCKEDFLAGVEWQKQREKPVNGELEGDD